MHIEKPFSDRLVGTRSLRIKTAPDSRLRCITLLFGFISREEKIKTMSDISELETGMVIQRNLTRIQEQLSQIYGKISNINSFNHAVVDRLEHIAKQFPEEIRSQFSEHEH